MHGDPWHDEQQTLVGDLAPARVEVLKLTFDDLQRENTRLREARSSVTRQLGPLPISAAIVAGLVSGLGGSDGEAHLNKTLAIVALGVFGVMVIVSIIYSALKPYRRIREEAETAREGKGCPKAADASTPGEWYRAMIDVESKVKGGSIEPKSRTERWLVRYVPLRRTFKKNTLATGYDLEWQGLFITKLLFVVVVILLILARIV